MAVDNFNRLIVRGPRAAASAFRRSVSQAVNRPTIGTIKGWREFVPLSIQAIRTRFDNVRRVTSAALDPFEISTWPTHSLNRGRVEIRYQFQTRNSEFMHFLKPLSRSFPSLTFVLVTLELDGGQITSFLVRRGVVRRRRLTQPRRQWHWDRARKRFGIEGDEVYESEEATFLAENGMLDEALDHWMPMRRRSWWNRPKVRDLDFERRLEAYEFNVERARRKSSHSARQATGHKRPR